MGDPENITTANQFSFEYTSTQSIFVIEVDKKISMRVTFLSPLTPDDLQRQSLMFSYMNVEVASLDGAEHDVQLYTDVSAGMFTIIYVARCVLTDWSAEWISGDVSATAAWDFGTADGIAYHRIYKQNQQLFSEINDRAEWGNFVSVSKIVLHFVCQLTVLVLCHGRNRWSFGNVWF